MIFRFDWLYLSASPSFSPEPASSPFLLLKRYIQCFKILNYIEPWPIFIEDFHGRTHEVILTPGDILFYESSKCFHGRPKRFNGGWYSSLFVHYYPSDGWYEQNHALEAHYAIPPDWRKEPPVTDAADRDTPNELEMIGTSMREPHCPNNWCRTMDSVQWSGPGRDGVWIAPTGQEYPFHPKHVVWNDELSKTNCLHT